MWHIFIDILTVYKMRCNSRLLSFSLSLELLGSLDFMLELVAHWLLFGFGRAFDKLKLIKHSTSSCTVKSHIPSFLILVTIVCNTSYCWYFLLAVDFDCSNLGVILLGIDYDGWQNTVSAISFSCHPTMHVSLIFKYFSMSNRLRPMESLQASARQSQPQRNIVTNCR
jgi:hypothetical protein